MDEILKYLYNLRRFGKQTGAVRAMKAMELLGNPQNNLRIIHVAGTNGKGSVCAYISCALRELGFSVGMFTSPHLVRVNERIRLNGEEISDDDFIKYYNIVKKVSDKMEELGYDSLAFFDFIFVMAVLFYNDARPDYVVMEAGLGGRDDATAALNNKLLAVITSISLDHTEILGDSVEQIAAHKAGIIAADTPVVYYSDDAEVGRVIEKYADDCNSRSYHVDEKSFNFIQMQGKHIDFSVNNSYYRNDMFSIGNTGLYQVMNATLALYAISLLPDSALFDRDLIKKAFRECVWAGRMEAIADNIYIDGAHNPDGINRFIETANAMKKNHGNSYLLFGAVREKNHDLMIKQICTNASFDGFILTPLQSARSLSTDVIEREFRKYAKVPVYVMKDVREAFSFARSKLSDDDILFCAGSLYLVGEIKELMGE